MNRFDELMNKYFDNEITLEELNEFQKYLDDESNNNKFCEMKNVEDIISKMKLENAPQNISEKIMHSIISETPNRSKKKSSFPLFINFSFISLIFITLGFMVITLNSYEKKGNTLSIVNKIIIDSSSLLISLTSMLSNKHILVIGFVLSMALIINFFINIQGHRSFLKKINNT